jgi:predicted small metal-binding protein
VDRTFACRELGMNCDWQTRQKTDDKVMEQVRQHAKAAHHINPMPQDMEQRVRNSIHDVR